jgi:hypothetical protein
MPSRLDSPSVEAEVTKEEGEVQVTITQVKFIDNRTRIKISKVTDNKTRIRISSLKEAKGEDQMTNKRKKYGNYGSECWKKQEEQL